MFKKNQIPLNQTIKEFFFLLWIFFFVGCGGGGGGGSASTENLPKISQVKSSVFSDQDGVYNTGQMVRFDIEAKSGNSDILGGTIRITSKKTGYDSGFQDLSFESIFFYHWDTSGLDPSDDYNITITLVDAFGHKTTDSSLIVTLTTNPPAINKLVSQVDLSVPAIGIPVRVVRTYLLDSGFDNALGFGWTQSYLMHLEETGDGLVKVFNADGSGSFFHPNNDGTYKSPKGDYRTLMKDLDGTFQVKQKNDILYRYTATGKIETIEDRNGNIVTFDYDADGLLTTITDASFQETTFTYSADNRLSFISDPMGRVVSYEYDIFGNLSSFTDVDGATTGYTYDTSHKLTTITDPSGRQTFFTIDAEDRLASVSNEGGINLQLYKYGWPTANEMTVTDALGNQSVYTFDNYSSITKITDPFGSVTYLTYDKNMNLTSLTDAAGNQTTFTYDHNGNVLTVTDSQGNTTTTTYEDQFNQVSTLTDANGNTTTFTYDSYGNLIAKQYPNWNVENFTYDGFGNLIGLKDANGNTTGFEYDSGGRLTKMTYSDGSSENYTYDFFGNLKSKTDRTAQTITYEYDLAGRLITKSYPDGTSIEFDYNTAGKLLSAEDINGAINFEYDLLGRLKKVTNQNGDVVSYGYDDGGNRTRLTYPNGTILEYTYDALNRPTRISGSGHMVAEYSYDRLSRVVRRVLKNGTFSTYDYDSSSQLLELINRKSTSEIISNFSYTYDNAGNRATMTTLNGLTQYTYDNKNQLTGVIYPDGSYVFYNFDPAGNRISEVVDGDRIDYTTNDLNQYTDVDEDKYTYDANGNMTSKTTPEGMTVYTYDFENRLVQVDTIWETITYTYDPFGRRTSKKTASGETHYILDGFRVIMEKDESDTIEARYIHGIRLDEVLVMNRGGVDYFYSQDGLGSVTDLTNFSEDIIESFTYDAYGTPMNLSSIGNPYLYTGREYEFELGLYHYRFRYYNPQIGRFSTVDPIGLHGGLNLYTYVLNNPIVIIDPFGLQAMVKGPLPPLPPGPQPIFPPIAFLHPPLPLSQLFPYPPEFSDDSPGDPCDTCKILPDELKGPDSICCKLCNDCDDNSDNSFVTSNVKRGDPNFIQSNNRMSPKVQSSSINENGLKAKISIPNEGSLVRANVPVFGVAHGKNFKEYRIEIGKGKEPTKWVVINKSPSQYRDDPSLSILMEAGDLSVEGNLATWDTGLKNYVYLPTHPKDHPIDLKGTYTIKLVVTGNDGSTVEDRVTVDVANVIPNAWGGQVTSKDGMVVLTVPEQAVMDSFRLILIDATETENIEAPPGRKIVGNIYRVKEPGEQFTKYAVLKMIYEKEAIGDARLNQLVIYGYNPKSKKWEYVTSQRDDRDKSVSASVRTLHAYYALMASGVETEGSVQIAVPEETPCIQRADALSAYRHIFVKNTFESSLGEWSNRDNEVGATVALDNSATYDGTGALKISNTHVGGNFAVNVITTPFDARNYQMVQFDYRIPAEVKTNFLVNVSGRWYEIGFTDDPKPLEYKRVNIAHIGDIQNVVADDQWHTARFNLYDMLRTKTGNTWVDAIIMADWDVDGYMKLSFGKNQKDATYYIDNFMISRESLAGIQPESDEILVDNFNQMNRMNALGGQYTEFKDSENRELSIDFSTDTPDGIGRALQLTYDVSIPGSYAGFSSALQNLDLRGFQRLLFYIKGETVGQDCMIGIKDSTGNESKVQLSRYLLGGATREWRAVDIPLVAFTEVKDWGRIDNISFGFETAISKKGSVYLDDIKFQKTLTALKIDDFENADFKNSIGKKHYTLVSGNAAVNGQYSKDLSNGIFRISYGGDIGKINAYASDQKSFAGWQTELGGVDCSSCQCLTMRVRGSKGGENFTVYLDDGNFRWGVNISQHAKITTDLQTISIPLAEFSEYGVDLTHLSALQVIFEGYEMSGTVYLDDIALQHDKEIGLSN